MKWIRREDQPQATPPPVAPPDALASTRPEPPTGASPTFREATATQPAFLSRVPVMRSSLEADSSVSGRLSFSSPTRIDGTLKGEVRATDLLVIGETACVEGTVYALNLIILGRVNGEVIGAERVEIGPSGSLTGMIETRALIVQEGGHLDGDCRIAPAPRATVHVLRPDMAADAT